MGWTCARLEKGLTRLQQVEQLEGLRPETVLASGCSGNVLYTAERLEDGRVIGCVYVFQRGVDGETCVKAMTENMGPYYFAAPAAVLDVLSEPENASATEWRAKCRATLQAKAAAKARLPKPKAGQRVRTVEDLNFGVFVVEAGTEAEIVEVTSGKLVVLFAHLTYRCRVSRKSFEAIQ